jgi:hypothetical protein
MASQAIHNQMAGAKRDELKPNGMKQSEETEYKELIEEHKHTNI